ncbi:MAG TPA: hypothetical protein PKO30_12910 [Prolixibacteraceae bacterium]|nr:hypothetical protein [Prolixibacteraceae bacterium]
MRKIIVFATSALVFAGFLAPAQEKWEVASGVPGTYSYSYHNEPSGMNSQSNYQLTAFELNAIKQKMQAVSDLMRKNRIFNPCTGFDAVARGEFTFNDQAPNQKAYRQLTSRFPQWQVYCELTGFLKSTSGKVKHYGGQPAEILCRVNDLTPSAPAYLNYRQMSYSSDADAAYKNACDKSNEIFRQPAVVKEIQPGVTAFSDGTVFVYKPGKPLWKSLTFEEYFKLQLEMYRQIALQDKLDPESPDGLVALFKKDVAGFPAEWLKMPCQSAENLMKNLNIEFNELPTLSGVFPIYGNYMRIDPGYFDPALPKSAIQVICITPAFDLEGTDCIEEEAWYAARCRFVSGVDFSAFQQLLSGQ